MDDNTVKQPLSDVICDALRKDILEGILKPGERLMEIYYAKKMGVSRTPFREAVRKLEIEGLVTVLPRRGAHVTKLSPKDICEVLDIRSALDMLAVGLFIENSDNKDIEKLISLSEKFTKSAEYGNLKEQINADVEFHEYIYKKSKNERLLSIYQGLKDHLCRYRALYLIDSFHKQKVTIEHNNIIHAIEKRDITEARKISELHIVNQKNNLK